MKKRHIITLMLCLLALWGKPHRAAAQFFSAKVNALAALTGTVNVGLDAAVADKWTLDVSGYWNPINSDSFSCRLYAAQIGTKRWLYEAFVGHFISGQLTYGNYLYGGSRHYYKGNMAGLGFSYGLCLATLEAVEHHSRNRRRSLLHERYPPRPHIARIRIHHHSPL